MIEFELDLFQPELLCDLLCKNLAPEIGCFLAFSKNQIQNVDHKLFDVLIHLLGNAFVSLLVDT
jgi:hypothetical protein